MDLAGVADELYGLDPADFTATRDRRAAEARSAGDRELAAAVKSLRRPSASAWAVNTLARERPDELGRLAALGAGLRDAQRQLEADELRTLGRRRQQVVAGLLAETRRLAQERGHALSDATAREVQQTFDAALADAEAAEAVRSGRLTRALEHTGFGAVDAEHAIALAPPGPRPRDGAPDDDAPDAARRPDAAPEEAAARRDAARREAAAARQAVEEADARLDDAVHADGERQRAKAAAEARVEELAAALEEARRAARAAATEARHTEEARRRAEHDAEVARRRAEAAGD